VADTPTMQQHPRPVCCSAYAHQPTAADGDLARLWNTRARRLLLLV